MLFLRISGDSFRLVRIAESPTERQLGIPCTRMHSANSQIREQKVFETFGSLICWFELKVVTSFIRRLVTNWIAFGQHLERDTHFSLDCRTELGHLPSFNSFSRLSANEIARILMIILTLELKTHLILIILINFISFIVSTWYCEPFGGN